MVSMPNRLTLPTALLALAVAACGDSQPQTDTAPATQSAAPAVPDVVRTADPAARGYTDADFPRVQEIAPDVYTYEALRTFGDDRVATVSMFVVTTEGVLVADGQGSAEETQALIDAIGEVTDQPITTVVVGSDHPDHSGGNSAFPASATFLAHPTSAARLSERGGTPGTIETVESERALSMGGKTIRVLHLGRAHTGGDLIVHLPQESVVFLGEVFMNRVFPSMASSYPQEWVATIQEAEALRADVYVPGHGFVDPPAVLAEELNTFRGAIQAIIVEVGHVFGEGAAVEEALGRPLGDVDTWTRAESLRESAIRRVYADLSGELVIG
jgi:glyoxylase-like metal-dependent hydrolase (beta-lactamase superfamily II)